MLSAHKILVLAPHTDDGEFGCGGTISKLISEGHEVFYVAFSNCEKSLPADQPRDTLEKELLLATKTLGISPQNISIMNFDVRLFERDRQEILDTIINISKRIKPDTVFVPSPSDLHQDHHTVAMEAIRALKLSATILGYEMPWNNLTFNTTCFVSLTEENIQRKIDALKCYISQASRFYSSEEFIKSLAVTRGTQIGTRYAETFEVLRLIIK